MSKKLLLAGYIGCGNLGDDAMMLAVAHHLRPKQVGVRALCEAPGELMNRYGIEGIPRKDPGQIKTAIEECDALVFPGGSIFQDVTSVRSAAYYGTLIKQAKKAGKPVIMLSQGVGPLKTWLGKSLAKKAFEQADAIVVRDPNSKRSLEGLGVKRPVTMAADLALLLPAPEGEGPGFGVGNLRVVGVSARPFGKHPSAIELFGGVVRQLMQAGWMAVMMELDQKEDGPLIQQIAKSQGGKVPDLRKLGSPMVLQQRLRRMDAVIAMRLHAGVLATTVGVPALMVSYDPKVDAFAQQLGIGPALPYAGATPDGIVRAFKSFIEDRDQKIATLEKRREELLAQARRNLDVLDQALNL